MSLGSPELIPDTPPAPENPANTQAQDLPLELDQLVKTGFSEEEAESLPSTAEKPPESTVPFSVEAAPNLTPVPPAGTTPVEAEKPVTTEEPSAEGLKPHTGGPVDVQMYALSETDASAHQESLMDRADEVGALNAPVNLAEPVSSISVHQDFLTTADQSLDDEPATPSAPEVRAPAEPDQRVQDLLRQVRTEIADVEHKVDQALSPLPEAEHADESPKPLPWETKPRF